MGYSPEQEAVTEFRMTPRFSVVYAQVLHALECLCDTSLSTADLMGSCEIKLIEVSTSKMVYRGYICLDGLSESSFERVEFCVTYHRDRFDRKSKESGMRRTETMIMLGWDSTVKISPRMKKKAFGCRLLRSYLGSEFDDVELQPKNWAKPYLWGGQVPEFLVSDELVASMVKSGASGCIAGVGGDLVFVDME